ncbi:MAG: OmpH family outer membrane protein, partial [Bacteroidota bacterium]
IVFIRLDSLTEQYGALQEMSTKLEAKAAEADQSQNERVAAFQRDVQNLQRRMNSGQMAPKQMGIEQERLAGREQALMQQAEQLRQELQLEQLTMMGEYEENLRNVLDDIQKEFGYDYILSYGAGTGVLMVNDAHDITAEVSKRINLIPMDGKSDKESAAEADAGEEATDAPAEGE